MQVLWSRVLAGEANSPGSYSKRTVKFLASLDKYDAELFTKLCTFKWSIDQDSVLFIYGWEEKIYLRHGINFGVLAHLESIGLIQFNNQISDFTISNIPKTVKASYYGKPIVLTFQKDSDNIIVIGKVLLTRIGMELAPICGSQPDADFEEYIHDKWRKMNYIKEEKTELDNPVVSK